MKFGDENFKEEFMRWLNSKTEEELVESLKKYAININEYSYEISNEDSLADEDYFTEIDIEKGQTQIKVKNEKNKDIVEIEEIVELGAAA